MQSHARVLFLSLSLPLHIAKCREAKEEAEGGTRRKRTEGPKKRGGEVEGWLAFAVRRARGEGERRNFGRVGRGRRRRRRRRGGRQPRWCAGTGESPGGECPRGQPVRGSWPSRSDSSECTRPGLAAPAPRARPISYPLLSGPLLLLRAPKMR